MTAPFSKSIQADRRFLNLPVKNGNDKITFQIVRDGQLLREFNMELALADPPDWWAFYDISDFAGQALNLQTVEGELPAEAQVWLNQAICLSDTPLGLEDLYAEKHRPQFHFTTKRGWNNDPNGMVFNDGEWHLFYQHNPFGLGWGNMHWGHAVSPDLVHWEELPTALYQRSLRDMVFSGGGLVDEANTAGFAPQGEAPLVVAFTSTARGECLAYSTDRGRTLQEYEGNPILVHEKDGRDPKIIPWGDGWVMIVYEELPGDALPIGEDRGYAFYTSADLKHWQRISFLPGYFECPELYELPVEGGPGERRWVISACTWEQSRSACAIGDFDGRAFTTLEMNPVSHYGPQFYAAQVFSNAPGGRVIMIGWLAGAFYPEMPFSQGMTVPLELSLRRTQQGTRLCFAPVKELESLRAGASRAADLSIEAANDLLAQADYPLLDVELTLRAEGPDPITLSVRGHAITWDPAASTLTFAGVQAPLPAELDPPENLRRLVLRVLVDRSVTEVFANAGNAQGGYAAHGSYTAHGSYAAAFASATLFDDPALPLRLEGPAVVEELGVYLLKSIW